MQVMITGATGFVGGHTAAALIRAGHEVVAFVRDSSRLAATMTALGVEVTGAVTGDMRDREALGEAMRGADVVIHCAAMVSLDTRHGEAMITTNTDGVNNLLQVAEIHGIQRIIYVSSASALFVPGAGPITVDSPPADLDQPYAIAKSRCETIVREAQERGAPIVSVYPAGVLGPPAGSALGEASTQISKFIAMRLVPTTKGSISVIDVRDLALILTQLVTATDPPARVMCGGSQVSLAEVAEQMQALTGRRIVAPPTPPRLLVGLGKAADIARHVVPLDTPLSEEAMVLATAWEGTVDTALDPPAQLRSVRETFRASILGWHERGLLAAHEVGSEIAESSTRPPLPKGGFQMPAWLLASRPFRRWAPVIIPRVHRLVHRITRGRTIFATDSQPMLVLTTTGAKSGQPRQTPLAAVPLELGKVLLIGSNFASDKHPAWTTNLLAHPEAVIDFRGKHRRVTARLLEGEERQRRWEHAILWYPNWTAYTEITDRQFRMFELTPTGSATQVTRLEPQQ